MRPVSQKIRFFSFLSLFFYFMSSALFAETFTGKIESIVLLSEGEREMILLSGEERKSLFLGPETEVESGIPAKKIKIGSRVHLSENAGGSGSRQGFKSPFKGIPKNMRKKMGLPEIPDTPEIPSMPEVPEIPKVPKIPKTSNQKSTPPPSESELSAEEKSLFGKADSEALSKSSESPSVVKSGQKVLKVETTSEGVTLDLEHLSGKKEQITLPPNKVVFQTLPLSELRENMTIQVEITGDSDSEKVQKIRVIE